MKIKDVAFFGFAVTDMKRARAFYEDILGLKVTSSYEDKFIEYDVGATTISIGTGSPTKPSADGGSVAFEVADFEDAIQTLKAKKIKFNFEPMDFGVCQVASISDPDGNTILIHKKRQK